MPDRPQPRPKFAFPEELLARAGDPLVAEVLMREEALFAARRQTLVEQTRLIRQQAQADEEAVALRRQIAAESRAPSACSARNSTPIAG